MKKLLSVVLALTLVLSLAACGGSSNGGADGDTIKIGVFEPTTGENGGGGV